MANLGFIGLGAMGAGMVRRLLRGGHSVTGYNRTKSKAQSLIECGMRWADTPRQVAETSEVILSSLADTHALQATMEGPDGVLAGLGPGKVYVDLSTVSPSGSREMAARVAETGAQMLDSPVSGSLITLEEGRLSLMVGGKREVFEQVKPILLCIGPKATYVGDNGQAVTMKVATNLSLAVQMLAFSEGMIIAEKGGIARETALEVLLNSVIASPMIKYRGPFVIEVPDVPWFNVKMMQKDLKLALGLGHEFGVPLPTTAATNEFLTAARAMGFEDQDFAVIYHVLRKLAGQESW